MSTGRLHATTRSPRRPPPTHGAWRDRAAHRLGDDLQWPHTPTQHPEGDAHRRADRRCLLGRAEESAADHSGTGPHQGPRPDERGSGQGVAPAHPEHHRTHDDDEQGLAQRESEVAEGLAQEEVTCSDRSCEGTREDAEPAGLDYRGTPGERLMNTNRTSIVGAL